MTPDELPTPPRKASWKRGLALTCVLAIILVALFLKAAAPEPVSVRFVHSTNYFGRKTLVFQGTNGTARPITYSAYFFTNTIRHAASVGDVRPYHDWSIGDAAAGASFTFFL